MKIPEKSRETFQNEMLLGFSYDFELGQSICTITLLFMLTSLILLMMLTTVLNDLWNFV